MCIRDRAIKVLVAQQVLELGEYCAVCSLEPLSVVELFEKAVVIDVPLDKVSLLIVVVVPQVQHRASIYPVIQKYVEIKRLIRSIELGDISQAKPLCKL